MSKARSLSRALLPALAGFFLLSGLITSQPGMSCANVLTEISPEERPKIIEQFKAAHKETKAISATVSQEKQLVALKKKVLVDGTILMSRPNMLKWDVSSPKRLITAIDGETMIVYHPDLNEAQVYVMSEHVIARNTVGFFSTAMSANLSEMEEKFSVTILRGGGEIVFKLVPLSKIVSRYISEVIIRYDEVSFLPLGFEMNSPKGDKTITKLSNFRVNPEIGPDAFRIKLPKDVFVTNRIEKTQN
jgi:outer membrane lipoprotein carrier protein